MSRALAHIRNPHAVQRIARTADAPVDKPRKPAPVWIDPVDALETLDRIRAQSLLAGVLYRDGSYNPDTLTLAQAHDVLRWAPTRIL